MRTGVSLPLRKGRMMKIVASTFDIQQVGPDDFVRINYSRQFCETNTLEDVIDWYMAKWPGSNRSQVFSHITFSYLETD